ncbi:MAG TPA: ParB/RepB/Spo0J family partition protein [Azospirillaceae bacterium]|nr:ParB/RepB/Spo0J family partition protein [Azospirillaceae bacterium]
MAAKTKRPSPILGAASAMIGDASDSLVTRESRFRHTFEAAVARIRPDPGQARKHFDPADLAALAATMKERGQLQPVLVRRDPEARGGWILVAGERRWRAAALNGWTELLAIEHDGDPEVAALLENLQRVDLSALEEARGLRRLIEGKGWSQAQAADALGKAKSEVSATLRILTLPAPVLDRLAEGALDLPRNVLVELARIEDAATLDRLLRLAEEGRLNVRAIRAARDGAAPAVSRGVVAEEPPARRFSFRALERVTAGLRGASPGALKPADRKRLEELRAAVDALLAKG